MILDIDAGNSCIKWRFTGPGPTVMRGIATSMRELEDALGSSPAPARVRLASVRGPDWSGSLHGYVRDTWSVEMEEAVSTRHASGVTNAYREPGRLGVDRWLAMLAARSRCERLFAVVDCGTALTLDVVGADGMHLGGYIVPGLSLQRQSLKGMSRIRLSDEVSSDDPLRPGRSTDEAIRNGGIAMLTGWLCNEARVRQAAEGAGLFVTGGEADVLALGLERAGLSVRREPDLVLDGLALAMP